jgi:hypothetical protein
MEKSKKKGFFSVEIESKKHLTNVSISNKPHERVVIEGYLGELSEIEMIENVLIQFKGANGVLRIDLSKDELWQKLSEKKEVE